MQFEKRPGNEEEYFKRQEIEQKKKWMAEKMERLQEEEREQLHKLHYMKCQKCGMDLAEIELEGVKVDRCVSCNGTWFDEGELQIAAKKHDRDLFSRMVSIFK